MERIVIEPAQLEMAFPMIDELKHRGQIQAMMRIGIVFQIIASLAQQSVRGTEAWAGGGPLGIFVHGEVHKTARELDEGLVKICIRLAAGFQPEIFQHIMSLVELPGIEALKVAEVTRIAALPGQMRDAIGDPSTLVRHAPRIL